jgi:hypothetical protein
MREQMCVIIGMHYLIYISIFFAVLDCLLVYMLHPLSCRMCASLNASLLRGGVVCKRAQIGGTALIRAATCGHAECTRLLLEAGADKDAQDKVCVGHRSPLH